MGDNLRLRHPLFSWWRKVAQGGANNPHKTGPRHLRHHPAPLRGVAVVVTQGGRCWPVAGWGGANFGVTG